jgi:hypothetical protein
MKKLVLSALLAAGFATANAQHLELGLHGGFGTTWMINSNVSDQGDVLDPKASFGPLFGLHAGYILPSRLGLIVDIDFAMDQQQYKGKMTLGSSTSSYEVKDKISYIEVPILLRKYSKGGFFFEIGPKFSFLSSAKETVEYSPNNTGGYTDFNVASGYKKTVVSGVAGIGGQFTIMDNLSAEVGLRLAYGFTDATVKFSETDLKGSAGHNISIGTGFAHYDQQGNYSYKSTHLATGHVLVGFTYHLPMGKGGTTKKK